MVKERILDSWLYFWSGTEKVEENAAFFSRCTGELKYWSASEGLIWWIAVVLGEKFRSYLYFLISSDEPFAGGEESQGLIVNLQLDGSFVTPQT